MTSEGRESVVFILIILFVVLPFAGFWRLGQDKWEEWNRGPSGLVYPERKRT